MKRILAFVFSCIAIVGVVVGILHFASLDETQHKIEYIVEGEVYHSQSAFVNAEIILPANPTRKDYDFDGWYYDDNSFSKKFDVNSLEGDAFSEDIKVYAKWVPHVHILEGRLTRKEDGKIELTAKCTACDYTHNEPDAAVHTQITKTATCLENGEITYSYSHLGHTFTLKQSVAKTGHQLGGKAITEYLNDKGQISVDVPGVHLIGSAIVTELKCGGIAAAIYVCSSCDRSVEISAVKNHDYLSEDALLELVQMDPEGEEYYVVNAKCGREECDFTASFNAEKNCIKTDRILTANTCSKDGAKIVTYQNPNSPIGDITVSTAASGDKVAIIPAHGLHKITGRADKYADAYANEDGSFNYYYTDGSNMFQNLFAGTNVADISCETYFEGYYKCSTCPQGADDANLVKVTVYKNHKCTPVEGTYIAPTCTVNGQVKELCANCNKTLERTIPATGHSIVYELTVVDDADVNYDNNAFLLSEKCEKCSYVATTKAYNNNDSALTHKKTNATCGSDGQIVTTCKFTMPDKTEAQVTCTQIIPATLKHILNGQIAGEAYANPDGTYYLTVDGVELTVANDNLYVCSYYTGTTQPGYFVCEYCEARGINAVVSVNVFVNHTGDWKVTNQPSCSATGTATLKACNECGDADDATFEVVIPATGAHVYKYELELVEGNSFNLTTTCWRIECGYKTVELITATRTIYKTATCSEKGIYRYTYNKDGVEVTLDVEYVDVHCHRINGQYIVVDNTTILPSDMPGIILPENYDDTPGGIIEAGFVCEDCGRYIIVNVKIVD